MTDSYEQLTGARAGTTEIGVHRRPWSQTIELALWHRDPYAGVVYLAQPLVMTQTAPDQETQPFMRLGPNHAQQLMDELYRCGVRPTEGAGSVGQLGAVQSHLSDMRRLVFDDERAKLSPRADNRVIRGGE